MAKECQLTIKDEVNIRFEGVDVATRRKMVDAMKFFLPYARHSMAYKLGRWDGTVSYCDVGGRSYINLLEKLLPVVYNAGYEVNVVDQRKSYDFKFETIDSESFSHIKWPQGHPIEGEPIKLRDHQVDVLNALLSNLQSVAIAATGAGKTIITAALSQRVQKYGRSVVIVPSKDLVTQTEEDYINMGLDVGVYFGDRKEYGKTHTICTWQSLEALAKRSVKGAEHHIDMMSDGVVAVICDEAHKCKADVLRNLLASTFKDVPIRWGMTGTLPEEDFEKVVLKAVIGDVSGKVSAKELQDKGILAKLHIHVEQLQDSVEFDNYPSELKWLTTNSARIDHMAERATEIAKTGNTLILVDRVKTGEMLKERIPNSVFISGTVKSTKRKEEYDEVREVDNKVIIATFGVASTGINIVRIFNLILVEPGKSFVRVIQSIGRGIRVAKDKDYVDIYDITSSCKYSKRHLTKRKKFYREQQFPFTINKVKW